MFEVTLCVCVLVPVSRGTGVWLADSGKAIEGCGRGGRRGGRRGLREVANWRQGCRRLIEAPSDGVVGARFGNGCCAVALSSIWREQDGGLRVPWWRKEAVRD